MKQEVWLDEFCVLLRCWLPKSYVATKARVYRKPRIMRLEQDAYCVRYY